ncbi:hypothetical protein G7085_15295 [Tessaracoccus sp. HDW20]|nr:hypothetical protein [Tessaracoccus coleopterorum]
MATLRRHFANSIRIGAAIAVVIMLVGVFGAHDLLVLMQTPPELMTDAEAFLVISFWAPRS